MKYPYFLFLLLSLFCTCALAQKNTSKSLKQCDALLARQLVEQQADDSKTVEETDKRVNILLRVADFLWISSEDTARKYFAEAFQVAQERFREKSIEKKEEKDLTSYQTDYRFNVIAAIGKRDAEWAKKLSEIVLKEFDEDKEKDSRNKFDKNREVSEISSIAARMAKDNPNLSLTLARGAMKYPLIQSWYFNLYEMARNNQPIANQIYSELLVNYPNAEVFSLMYLSAYPFGNERIFGVEKYNYGASGPATFTPNQKLQRQFLLTLLRRVMKLNPENTNLSMQGISETASAVMALNDLELIVNQQFPDLAQFFSQAKIHAN